MREWDVIGANRTTGATLTMRVLADDEEDAIRTVGGAMLVERVLPAVPDARAAGTLSYASPKQSGATKPMTPTVPTRPDRPAPAYHGIVIGSIVLWAVGLLFVLLGLIAAAHVYARLPRGTWTESPGEFAQTLVAAAAPAVYGILIIFVASLGAAVRDIARNSFGSTRTGTPNPTAGG